MIPVLVVLSACSTTSPPKDAPHEHADASAVVASSASAVPPASPRGCATDADCRTWSSYCNEAPCACRVYAKNEPEPHCLGPSSVRCLVDPCQRKAAACQDGQCVLVGGPTQ